MNGFEKVIVSVCSSIFILMFDTFVATWLWGQTMVPLFSLPSITYWQMFGLIWLFRLFTDASMFSPIDFETEEK